MNLPIILKFKALYLIWQEHWQRFPKAHKYSIGLKLDQHLLVAIESVFLCLQEDDPARKLAYLRKANSEIDVAKFLLDLCYCNKSLSAKQLESLSEATIEIGRILGGWKKGLLEKQPKH
jgi:hypothetical protein